MKSLLGNSCAKGCLVYLVALVLIVGVTAFGLGGLKAKFGASTGNTGPSSSILGNHSQAGEPVATPNQPKTGDVAGGSVAPTPTPVPPILPAPMPPSQPGSGPGTGTGNPVGDSGGAPSTPQVFTPVQNQGGVISGEASQPFYIVQPGDTLWEIATHFGVDVNALLSVNSLGDNTIYPGQVLYLPQAGTGQGGGGSAPVGANEQVETPGPDTGSANDTSGPDLPNMPNTGINHKP